MSTLDATANEIDPAFAAWAAQLRALRAEHGRPIADQSDPRFASVERAAQALTPQKLGEHYFEHHTGDLWPSCPLPSPSWSTERSVETSINDWPIVNVWDYSEWITFGEVRVRRERFCEVAVDELPPGWNEDDEFQPKFGELFGLQECVVLDIAGHGERIEVEASMMSDLAAAVAAFAKGSS